MLFLEVGMSVNIGEFYSFFFCSDRIEPAAAKRLLLFSFLMICGPLTAFFGTKKYLDGKCCK